jgi:hypothetical protein
MTQSCHQNARWEGCARSITSICLERKKGAEPQEDDGCCDDRAGELANSGGNRGESCWKKRSGKATQDEQPAKDGDKHRPSVRPAIVNAHNGKPSDEQEDARHEDERWVAGNLFRQRRERARVQQHAGSDSDKGGPIRPAIVVEVVIYAPLRTRHRAYDKPGSVPSS